MENESAIAINNLHKRFGETQALRGLDFTVNRGEIFSLLGPNGAGKSTTIAILSGLLRPDQGEITVLGCSLAREARRIKAQIGVVPQEIALYEDLSPDDNLDFWGRMYGLHGAELRKRTDEVLELVGLREHRKARAGHFSGGMKRRLNIAIALIHAPRLVIMDEPTVGIDPQSRRHILDSIRELNAHGITILYTTHYMEEAQELSHRIAIVDHGQLIALGTHAELLQLLPAAERADRTLETVFLHFTGRALRDA